jgi:hypothetical protein
MAPNLRFVDVVALAAAAVDREASHGAQCTLAAMLCRPLARAIHLVA